MKPKFGVKRSKAMNQSYQGKITTSIKYVVIAMSMTVAVSTSQADVVKKQIGDLEIYALPTPGNPNIMMMLDISGSMNSELSGCKSDTTQTSDTKFVYTGQSARYYRVGIRYNFGKSFTIEQSKSSSEKGRL